MLFNSWQFAIFFPIVTILYFALPHRMRWALLLAASCGFYMAFVPVYILILLLTIVIDYLAGIGIERTQGSLKKSILVVSIVSNIGILAFFKYFNFLNVNVAELVRLFDWNYSPALLDIILPIGLSFHTFQSLSYTIEVYRGRQAAERHFGIFALYVMFYPQLVAGPIERPQNLLHQFHEKHFFDAQRVTNGLVLMTWGLFKKVVIADRLAIAVNHVYADPTLHSGPVLLLATAFFAFQVYCDFSGYSDIVLGTAEVMGFRLMQNFKHPYFAASMPQFWKRWHVSLSTWSRDYVFIPLGGFHRSVWRPALIMLITFSLSGLWHGASWNFIIWGCLNGFFVIFYMLTERYWTALGRVTGLNRIPGIRLIGVLAIFCQFAFTLIFFRANTFADAMYITTRLFEGPGSGLGFSSLGLSRLIAGVGMSSLHFTIAIASLLFLLMVEFIESKGSDIRLLVAERSPGIRWVVYYGLLLSICLFGVFNQSQFIYFQF